MILKLSPRSLSPLVAIFSALLMQGCATDRSLYYWGEYEPMIFNIYMNPGEADVDTQILTISELIEKAQSKDKKVPPGVYAHLGMLHAQSGSPAAALDAFNMEKELFPESSVFIDGIVERSQLSSTQQAPPSLIELPSQQPKAQASETQVPELVSHDSI